MIKKIIWFVLAVALLTGCAPLVKNWDIRMQEPSPSPNLSYTDEFIDINFTVDDDGITFILKNKTENNIKINFNEVSYLSPEGASLRIVNSSLKVSKKSALVQPGLNISNTLIPSENVFFRGYFSNFGTGLNATSLFPNYAKTYVGKEFGLYFPMEIKGVKKEYTFKFKINSMRKQNR